MHYPDFFDKVPSITLKDPLADILGSIEDGLIEFNYIDIVKMAGHSCPTVAGAYLMTLSALEALYGDEMPIRGNISVQFSDAIDDGVTGVIANVISNITGATDRSGFKGLNGKFVRHSLMHFSSDISSSARFTRTDTLKSVDIFYDPSSVPPNAAMGALMPTIMSGNATLDDKREFGRLWQLRVEAILLKARDDVIKVVAIK